jgi:hypothetical protein
MCNTFSTRVVSRLVIWKLAYANLWNAKGIVKAKKLYVVDVAGNHH